MLLLQAVLQPLPIHAAAPIPGGFPPADDRVEKTAVAGPAGAMAGSPPGPKRLDRETWHDASPADETGEQASVDTRNPAPGARPPSGASTSEIEGRDASSQL